MPEYQIIASRTGGLDLRGGALAMWKSRAGEVMLSGPAETGKTFATLSKLDALCWKYPGLHCLMARKSYKSIKTSACVTYEKKVLGAIDDESGRFRADLTPVRKIGGESVQAYEYPNGSRIVVGGLDNADKVLSAEYDVIYINQAEELTLDDWEKLTTRATGRAGNLPWGAQVLGDCNPGPDTHWILARRQEGSLEFHESRHEDNPRLFDGRDWTPEGVRSLAVLERLTGVRKARLRFGRWVRAEGVVYEAFDRAVHVVPESRLPKIGPGQGRRYRVVDFGYRDPFVCQWWLVVDDRCYLYRELYRTGRLVEDHAREIRRLEEEGEIIDATICDHDAEDRATLERHLSCVTTPAYKGIAPGIEAVQSRLRTDETGRPALMIVESALVEADEDLSARRQPVCTEQEFDVYAWPKAQDGKPLKEVPVDLYNHGMDAMRYLVAHVDRLGERKGTPSGATVPVPRPTADLPQRPAPAGVAAGASRSIPRLRIH